jgi:imidazolonepropionase-like amidohydrolase
MQALVTESHRLGRKVATHAHSSLSIKDAVKAGVDSIEHGIFLDEEGIALMKQHGTFLVPTSYPLFWFEENAPAMHMPPWVIEKAAIIILLPKEEHGVAAMARVTLNGRGVYPHGQNGGNSGQWLSLGLSPVQALQAGTVGS